MWSRGGMKSREPHGRFQSAAIYGIEGLFESSPIVELGLKYAVIMPRWTFCRVDAFWAHFGILPNFECCEVAKKKCHLLSFAGAHHEMFFENQYFFLLSFDEPRSPKTAPATKRDKPKSPNCSSLLDCTPSFPWLFLHCSFLFLTVPLQFLSFLDGSFADPFLTWLFV